MLESHGFAVSKYEDRRRSEFYSSVHLLSILTILETVANKPGRKTCSSLSSLPHSALFLHIFCILSVLISKIECSLSSEVTMRRDTSDIASNVFERLNIDHIYYKFGSFDKNWSGKLISPLTQNIRIHC
jgi:hypothetical protein